MKRTRLNRNSKGFTLLEIIVVASIGALIVGAAIVKFSKAKSDTTYKIVPDTVHSIKAELGQFTSKAGGYPYPPITAAAATSSIPTTGSALGASAPAVVSAAATLDIVFTAEGYSERAINLGFGTSVNTPNGAKTKPLLWNPTTNTFYCNPDGTPDYDYTNMTRVICQLSTTNIPGTDGTNYYLDKSLTAIPANTRVVSLVIPQVQAAQAANLANFVDNMTTATAAAANSFGHVTYGTPAADGTVTVYYLVDTY